MPSFKAKNFLRKAAKIARKDKEAFNKEEITKKVNEIKYLATQKKVPKLSIRKEIVHLENLLKGVFELEKKLLKKEKEESVHISSLKKQIDFMKKKLGAEKDNDLQQKVEKLSHLLGDYLARRGTQEDIALSKQVMQIGGERVVGRKARAEQLRVSLGRPAQQSTQRPQQAAVPPTQESIARINMLQQRLDALKHELGIHRHLEKDPAKVQMIQQQVALLEGKLKEAKQKTIPPTIPAAVPGQPIQRQAVPSPGAQAAGPEVKHTMMLGRTHTPPPPAPGDKKTETKTKSGLPPPPPPRYK